MSAKGTKIVVIDDDAALRASITLSLQLAAYEVVGAAADGAAGVEVVRQLQPDAVILDLEMPVLGGREALPLLRSACPTAAIVVYSLDLGAQKENLPADAVISKVTPPDELVNALRELLGHSRG